MENPILKVSDLQTSFFSRKQEVPVVNGVDFHVNAGEILGVVGESGCGKSVTSLSIMGLVPSPEGKVVGGEILFKGEDLTKASRRRMRQIRGNEISMIFQEPMTSLNPVFTIGDQLVESIRIHHKMSKQKARQRAVDILQQVGLPRADELLDEYPHQLSGGMRQRVMIAMAVVCEPDVLIADEPTTALDVTIQAQILDLMKRLNKQKKTSIILITHDLGVVAEICDRIVVMYAGEIVEEGTVRSIFRNPKHPYTKGLIRSVPDVRVKKDKLYSIPGHVPEPGTIIHGCPFRDRCEFATEQCVKETPQMTTISEDQSVKCLLYEEEEGMQHGRDAITS